MKKYLPYLVFGLGLMFIGIAMVLRAGTADTEAVITNLSSSFMGFAGVILVLGGLVTYFLRDDEAVW